jgi:uncharacterized protein YybS (DUF2232 family)
LKNEEGGFSQRDFVHGVVISALMFLSVVLVPLVGAVAVMLTPLPVLYYYTKFGRIGGVAVFGSSLAVVLFVLGWVHADIVFPLLLFLLTGAAGILLAEALGRQWSIEKTLLLPSAGLMAFIAGLLILQSFQTGQSPWRLLEGYILVGIQENVKIYKQMDISSDSIALISDSAGQIAALLAGVSPALFLVGAVLLIWINLAAARRLFQKRGLHYPEFGDLTCWKAPEKMVWLLIGTGGMLLAGSGAVQVVGLNLLIICLSVYLCAGLAVVGFFFRIRKIPIVFKVSFYILILLQQYLLLLVVALGLFDLWADFRKRIKPVQDAGV